MKKNEGHAFLMNKRKKMKDKNWFYCKGEKWKNI